MSFRLFLVTGSARSGQEVNVKVAINMAKLTAVGGILTALATPAGAANRVTPSPAPAIGSPSSYLTPIGQGAPKYFMAQWITHRHGPTLELFSSKTGKPVGSIANLWPNRVAVTPVGPHRAGRDNVWLTTTTGPVYRSDIAGGDPAPNSCNATVSVLDPFTHTTSVLWRAPHSSFVQDVVPSSSGKRYVLVTGGCNTSFDNTHLVVATVGSTSTVTIGLHETPCHVVSVPSWNENGTSLTFAFSPSALKPSTTTTLPLGVCQAPGPGEIAIVSSWRSGSIESGRLIKAPSGCQFVESAFDAQGIVAAETCGPMLTSTTDLVQLTADGVVEHRVALKPNANPIWLSVSPSGRSVLVNEYQANALPGNNPLDWVWTFDGHSLKVVGRYFDANDSVRSAAW